MPKVVCDCKVQGRSSKIGVHSFPQGLPNCGNQLDQRGHGWLARYQQVSKANYEHAALGITPTKHMLNTRLCDACIESPYTSKCTLTG